MLEEGEGSERVYIVCFNPHCLKSQQRCLTTRTLHSHPNQCSHFYYPVEQILKQHWTELDKYPMDSLGKAVRKKYDSSKDDNFLVKALQTVQFKQLEEKLTQLYPTKQFSRCYTNVYGLDKVAESLRLQRDPGYISNLLNTNFSAQNYHLLLRLNDSYDQMGTYINSLSNTLLSSFDGLLKKKKSSSSNIVPGKPAFKKLNYGIYKSKFVGSLKIEVNKSTVNFPKLPNIASFLPWIYTDRYFTEGTHEFKINSLRYPIVQNAGFTILPQHDIDTYPYSCFKSLFSRDGKGFTLMKGNQIDQFVAQTTVITLRLQLGPQPKAIIYDSQVMCQYECLLPEKQAYRMGVYGCGWAMDIIQLN